MSKSDAVKEMHAELFDAIVEIDEKLDSLSDSASAGKRKVTSNLVDAAEGLWSPVVEKLLAELSKFDEDPAVQVGLYKGIVGKLNSAYSDSANTYVETVVEEAPEVTPLITPEEAVILQTQRSELYKNCKNVIELAATMYSLELESPKVRRGSTGKRGKRNTTLMNWALNGEPLDVEMLYKEVAEAAGFETIVKTNDKGEEVKTSPVAQLTQFLKDKGIDTKEATEIEVTLPNGQVLTGWMPDDSADETGEEETD